MKISSKLVILFFLIIVALYSKNIYAVEDNPCYTLIENKAGCSGVDTIENVKYIEQLKCFKVNKKSKNCNVFIGILPSDNNQGLSTTLTKIDCVGENRNSEDCINYCFNNPNASSGCVDCDTLTDSEKAEYLYCQDEKTAVYCEAVDDDNNGSSWPKSLAGTSNVVGTCLDGYEIDESVGAPKRNCLSSGIWDSQITLCISAKCIAISEVEGATYTNGYATWSETDKNTNNVEGTCIQDYEQVSSGVNPTRNCDNGGEWQEVDNSCVPVICPYLYDGNNYVQWPESTPGSNTTIEVEGICDVGYKPANDEDYPVRICNRDGTWGSISVGCVASQCNNSELTSLNPIANSEYNYTNLGISSTGKSNYGITVNGNCSTGYEKANSSSTISATCNSNGEWEFNPSTDDSICQIKTCSIESASSYAVENLASWTSNGETYDVDDTTSTINYGETLTASACETDYTYSGTIEIECIDTDTWSVIGTNNGVCMNQVCSKANLLTKIASITGSKIYENETNFGMYGTSYKSDMSVDVTWTGTQSVMNYNAKPNSVYFANGTFVDATCTTNYREDGATHTGTDYTGGQKPVPLTSPDRNHHYYCENGTWKVVGGCKKTK